MDETLREVYDLVLQQWPLVAAAYAVLWATLVIYIGLVLRRLGGIEKEMAVLEEAVARRRPETAE